MKIKSIPEPLPSDFPDPLSFKDILIYSIYTLVPLVYSFIKGYIQNFWINVLVFLGGIIFWTLIEYLIHRFLFHPFVLKRVYRLIPRLLYSHGLHHKYPGELDTGLLKPYMGIPVVFVFFLIFYLFLGRSSFVFTSGFIFGYTGYGILHFVIHHYSPIFGMKALWKHHFAHHHEAPDKAYGVTTTFWDFLFGTLPPKIPTGSRTNPKQR